MRSYYLFFFLILATSCAHSDFSGSWRGTTTQELPTISFKVARGAITELALEWVLPLSEPCKVPTQVSSDSTAPLTKLHGNQTWYFNPYSRGNEPLKIDGKAWRSTVDAGAPSQVQLAIAGTFLSGNEASGTLEITSKTCQASTRIPWKTIKETKSPMQDKLDPTKAESSDFNGSWTGTIGDAKPIISFAVVGNVITEMTLQWVLPLTEPCVEYPGSPLAIARLGGETSLHFFSGSPGSEPLRIAGKAWKSTVDVGGGGPGKVELVFTGTFTSATEASGTLAFTPTACRGSAHAAWRATKQN